MPRATAAECASRGPVLGSCSIQGWRRGSKSKPIWAHKDDMAGDKDVDGGICRLASELLDMYQSESLYNSNAKKVKAKNFVSLLLLLHISFFPSPACVLTFL